MSSAAIRLLLADVDGTLVTNDKTLTDRAIAAAAKLRQADILLALTSGRPPRGMSMLTGPLEISTPIAAFNGGLFARPDMSVIEQQVIADDLTPEAIDLLTAQGMSVWVYRGADWFILDPQGPHVDRESRTVKFDPTPVDSFSSVSDNVAKIVGVSDDYDAVDRAVTAARERFGEKVSASKSQPYYVDITHPDANKGYVVGYLAELYKISPEEIATIGDMPNDTLMFAKAGLSIAMGHASDKVQRAADNVTTSNEDEGFANAVEQFILSSQ